MAYTYQSIEVRPPGSIKQSLKTRAELDGVDYVLLFYFCAVGQRWYMDLLRSDETAICRGRKMVLGVDLIWGFHGYEGAPPGALVVLDRSGADQEADLEGFDERCQLIYRGGEADAT